MTKRKDPSEKLITFKIPKPRFKANQEVWYMFNNRPTKDRIDKVMIEVSVRRVHITYTLSISDCGFTNRQASFPDTQLFRTKEELLESLV